MGIPEPLCSNPMAPAVSVSSSTCVFLATHSFQSLHPHNPAIHLFLHYIYHTLGRYRYRYRLFQRGTWGLWRYRRRVIHENKMKSSCRLVSPARLLTPSRHEQVMVFTDAFSRLARMVTFLISPSHAIAIAYTQSSTFRILFDPH